MLGTPFELSVTSFLLLAFEDSDTTLSEENHDHLYPPIHSLLSENHQRNATFEIMGARASRDIPSIIRVPMFQPRKATLKISQATSLIIEIKHTCVDSVFS